MDRIRFSVVKGGVAAALGEEERPLGQHGPRYGSLLHKFAQLLDLVQRITDAQEAQADALTLMALESTSDTPGGGKDQTAMQLQASVMGRIMARERGSDG